MGETNGIINKISQFFFAQSFIKLLGMAALNSEPFKLVFHSFRLSFRQLSLWLGGIFIITMLTQGKVEQSFVSFDGKITINNGGRPFQRFQIQ